MTQSLTIPGRFPVLNEMLAAARARRGKGSAYSAMKKEMTEIVMAQCSIQDLRTMYGPVEVHITAFEINKRRDPDNISAGAFKFVLDGLVKSGIIETDSQKIVKKIVFDIGPPDKENPRVEVEIVGLNDE